jgi:SAM-dependent methyltransferase
MDAALVCQNGVMNDAVGPHPQYDVFADEFLDHARNNLYNAHYDRPACLSLLGDVAGLTVLDAACGPGLYAEELAARGANVIGFDQSPRMAELSEQRVPTGRFHAHDLADPLDWLPDQSVDLVLFALALEYVDDRIRALREFRRVLRPAGALVLSRQHPTGDWPRHGGSYFDVRYYAVQHHNSLRGYVPDNLVEQCDVRCPSPFPGRRTARTWVGDDASDQSALGGQRGR